MSSKIRNLATFRQHLPPGAEKPLFLTYCAKILKHLLSQRHEHLAWPFYKPVDVIGLGLFDYFDIIKEPMDLGRIKKKLNEGQYNWIHEFHTDIKLIFNNCYTYNPAACDVVQMGKKLEMIFDKMYRNLPPEIFKNEEEEEESTESASESSLSSSSSSESEEEDIREQKLLLMQERLKAMKSGHNLPLLRVRDMKRLKRKDFPALAKSSSGGKRAARITPSSMVTKPRAKAIKRSSCGTDKNCSQTAFAVSGPGPFNRKVVSKESFAKPLPVKHTALHSRLN